MMAVFFLFILHNHGRFLYPIYPLICVAASAVIESFPDFFQDKYNPNANYLLVTVSCFYSYLFLLLCRLVDQGLTFHGPCRWPNFLDLCFLA